MAVRAFPRGQARDLPGAKRSWQWWTGAGLVALAIVLAAAPLPAVAQEAAPDAGAATGTEEVLLQADLVTYDESLGVVSASGNVELYQGARILLADTVTYNLRTEVVTATGNVVLLEPTGEVLFADYAELTDDLARGFVDNIRILLGDNARIAANEGERTDGGRFTRLNRAVYSPCELCPEDPTRPPLWQLRAVRVTHDAETQDVIYRDARLELFGVPVFYTPYFSHPDPTVDRRSGFLAPVVGFSDELGFSIRTPYYLDIAPDKDATLAPGWSEEDGPFLRAEYRQRFARGRLLVDASGAYAERVEGNGAERIQRGRSLRGHLFGTALFDLSPTWRAGADIARTTDDTYLRRYRITEEDLLESRVYGEYFRGRDYGFIGAYDFQDLRPGANTDDPLILPYADFSFLGEPDSLLGGRLSLDVGLLGLNRDNGRDVRRLATAAGWQRRYITDFGAVATLTGRMRADGYVVRTSPPAGSATDRNLNDLRLFPTAQAMVRYPLSRQSGRLHQLIEPIAALTVAPSRDADRDIPNEDSLDLEFDETNLFRINRFPGIDRLEGGQRIDYGVRIGVFGFRGGRSSLFLGQSYRFQDDETFPSGSGLEDRLSDIVGRLEVAPNRYLDLIYRFRLNKERLDPRRHELAAVAGPPIFRPSVSYISVDRLAGTGTGEDREELTLGLTSNFARHWTFGGVHTVNLAAGSATTTQLTLTYEDECFLFQVVAERDYTVRSGLESGDSIFFRLVFRTLGEVESPTISGPFFGSDEENGAI